MPNSHQLKIHAAITILHVLKGKKFLAGVSVKDCTPINEIIAEIDSLTAEK